MAVLCIAGISSGIGKTSVAEMLLGDLNGWHVARVRVADEIPDARLARLGDDGYALLTSTSDAAADPDLRRLLDAGAPGAGVLLAEARGLEPGIKALRARLRPDANLLVEGNAYLWAAEADLAVMVIGPGPSGKGLARVRRSVRELFSKIGVWVWNTRTNPADEGFFEFPQALARMGLAGAVSNRADFHHANPARPDAAGNAPFRDAVRARLERAWARRGATEFLRRIGFDEPGPG